MLQISMVQSVIIPQYFSIKYLRRRTLSFFNTTIIIPKEFNLYTLFCPESTFKRDELSQWYPYTCFPWGQLLCLWVLCPFGLSRHWYFWRTQASCLIQCLRIWICLFPHDLIQMNTPAGILTRGDGNTFNSSPQSGQEASRTNPYSPSTWGLWSTFPSSMSFDPQNNPQTRRDNYKSLFFTVIKSEALRREMKLSKSLWIRPQTHITSFCRFSWCMINSSLMSILVSLWGWGLSVSHDQHAGPTMERANFLMAVIIFFSFAINIKNETNTSITSIIKRQTEEFWSQWKLWGWTERDGSG